MLIVRHTGELTGGVSPYISSMGGDDAPFAAWADWPSPRCFYHEEWGGADMWIVQDQCVQFTGMPSPDNQTRSWLTSQNNQKVVLTGIQYHFGPEPETGPDRPSRALEASDRHLYTPKQPFNFKYISFLAVSDLLRLLRDVSRPYSYFSRVLDQSDAGGHG